MTLGTLPDPKAAFEILTEFKRRYSAKVCMAPSADHAGRIVSAHTLSVEAMLRKISRDSHVYAGVLSGSFSEQDLPIEIRLRGLRDVSVFNGFCQNHDIRLFSCLEQEPFCFSRKQLFMLAYRSTARECYLKRKQFESLPTPEQLQRIHRMEVAPDPDFVSSMFATAILKGAQEIESYKEKLDQLLLAQSWDRLETKALLYRHTPTVIGTGTFQPFEDCNGCQLQDVEDLESDVSMISLTLIPTESGGAAIFSWLDTSNSAPRRFFEAIAASSYPTSAGIHAVLDNMENFAISPDWYDSLTTQQRFYLFSRALQFTATSETTETRANVEKQSSLGDWGEVQVCSF